MTNKTTARKKFITLTVAVLVVLGTGSTVALAASPGQIAQQSPPTGDNASVTAENISAEQIQLENVEVSNLTVDLSDIQSPDSILQDSFSSAVGGNVEGFAVESIDIGSIQSASVSIEDNVAIINAQVETVTLTGVSADRVTVGQSEMNESVARPMLEGGELSFESVTVQGLSIGTVTSEPAAAGPPAEPPAEPETPTPTEPTDGEEDNVTDGEEEDNVTDGEEEDNVTDGEEEDNVTDGAVGGDGDNVTDGEEDNVTDGEEDNVTNGEEAAVTFENQSSDGMVVNVTNFTVPDGGYVAIHNDSLLEGDAVGSVIGVSEYFEAGTYENESISLFNVSGVNFTETQLTESQTLIAMPHLETNQNATENATYDFVATNGTADGPYTSNGSAVTDAANITVSEPVVDGEEDNFTDGEEENVTDGEEENVTDGEEENVTDGEEENVTDGEEDGAIGGDGDNVTDGEEDNVTDSEEDDTTEMEGASVTFEDQTSDGMVINLANFTVPDGGYVAIHNDSLLEGDAVGSVIGTSVFIEAGTYEDVNITLFDVPGVNFSQSQLTESQTLIAMPHQETNDNITYDFVATNGTADGPYTSNGSAVTDAANITVNVTAMDGEEDNVTDGEEEENVTDGAVGGDGDNVTDGEEEDNVTNGEEAAVTFEDQSSDGMVVNVTNFTVPDGGYVAIHNDSLLEGDAVGSVIGASEFFEPGTYENESISLFNVSGVNFTEAQLNGSQTLIAMPHQETNQNATENATYDFVATNGTADGPYTSNGTAVTDAANITVNVTAMDGEEDNVTDGEEDNVTDGEEDNITNGEQEDNITDGEEDDNVTNGAVGGDGNNVTDSEEDNVTDGEDDNVTERVEAAVTFENQTSDGMVVNVTNFTVPDGGYIAIHNDSLLEGDAVGSVIGVSEFFEPGIYENQSISLFNVSGANFTETQLNGSQTLIAMPHQETNQNATENTTYDFVATNGTADGPYTSNETAVTDNATVTVNETAMDGEEDNVTTEEASVTFESQATDGTAVTIANFTVPDGGYVAIHNDSLLEGDAVGSVIGASEYFEAGTYENESVSLFNVSGANFTEAQLNVTQTLIAMPHQETNQNATENTTYDFVATNGTADGPYTSNGSAVTDNATVATEG